MARVEAAMILSVVLSRQWRGSWGEVWCWYRSMGFDIDIASLAILNQLMGRYLSFLSQSPAWEVLTIDNEICLQGEVYKVNWSWRQQRGGPMPGVTPITHLVVLAVAEDNKSTWVDLMWQLGSATDYQLRPGQGCIIFLQTVLCRNIYILRKLLKWSWVTPSLTPVPSIYICIQALMLLQCIWAYKLWAKTAYLQTNRQPRTSLLE